VWREVGKQTAIYKLMTHAKEMKAEASPTFYLTYLEKAYLSQGESMVKVI